MKSNNIFYLLIGALIIGYQIIKAIGYLLLIILLCVAGLIAFGLFIYGITQLVDYLIELHEARKERSYRKVIDNSVKSDDNVYLDADAVEVLSCQIEDVMLNYADESLTKDRFINIMRDLYPDRYNRKKYNILSDLLSDKEFIDEMFSSNVDQLVKLFNQTASLMCRKTHYNRDNVMTILYALAIGSGCITDADYRNIKIPAKQ